MSHNETFKKNSVHKAWSHHSAKGGSVVECSSTENQLCYAHSTEQKNKVDWQLLQDHLLSVGELAAANAAPFGGAGLARVAGLLHDLGKYTSQFQKRLAGEHPRMDHATWGARIARERYGVLGSVLAYGIAGHHAGLANGVNGKSRSSLRERLQAELHPLLPQWQEEIALPEAVALPDGYQPDRSRGAFQLSLLARMLFSCLVDADFIDTDNYYRRIEQRSPRDAVKRPGLQQLREKLEVTLKAFRADTEVNLLRADVLSHVRSQAGLKPGMFSLTVPTGGGKTLASLAFALDHALAHGLRRVIYVIPFTSIVEQSAQVFRNALGGLGDAAVLEHHSAFVDDPRQELESKEKRRLAMENWDAPIVVTTAVQFFESLFADRPARCRKLHNIAGSVVILDEVQTLPLHLLRPCVTLLDELALNYRASLVLCTATQPALLKEQGFKGGLENVRELAPSPRELYRKLRRATVRHVGVLDDRAVIEHLRQRQQVLCIVNNRRHARHLFEAIADVPGSYHLTTLMYARHRSWVLDQIRARLREGLPCRLVSTSLIEAGVDIDFPAVLRAEAGLDSIAQAAGRCNREGRRPVEESEVLVFETADPQWAPPEELKRFAAAFRAIERHHRNDLLALPAIEAYFQELYWQLGEAQLDKTDLLGMLKGADVSSLPLETLATLFRVIQTTMNPVIVPFDPRTGTADPLVEAALRDLQFAPSVARQLQPYLVQVPQQAYDALWNAHAIQPVAPERYGKQFVQLVNPRLYDARVGLHWDNPQFIAADQLVI